MTSSTLERTAPEASSDKGLKKNAVGFWDALAVGLDSTAPAYSIAAILGSLVVVAGVKAPAVMLVSFVPILLTAGAFYYMGHADPDCGATFSWVRRTMGPVMGWLAGWAVLATAVLVIGAQSDVAAYYLFDVVGADSLRDSRPVVVGTAVVIVLAMTWASARNIQFSAKVQRTLIFGQLVALLAFVAACIWHLFAHGASPEVGAPDLSWFSPFDLNSNQLVAGLLLGVFAYWGWDSALNLAEESRNRASAPGAAALTSTIILLVTYVGTAVAVVGVSGLALSAEYDDDPGLLGAVAHDVLGPFAALVVLSIITAGVGSTQSTILPQARTALSMASVGALPSVFGRVNPRTLTPRVGTWVIGLAAAVWYVAASAVSTSFLFDSLSALAILVALYYGLTGVSCVVYWRRQWRRGAKAVLLVGVAPLLGAAALFYMLYRSAVDMADPANSYSGQAVLGVGAPLAIAIGLMALGVLGIIVTRIRGDRAYFARRGGEYVDERIADEVLGGPGVPEVDPA